jgi:hypothetical protein
MPDPIRPKPKNAIRFMGMEHTLPVSVLDARSAEHRKAVAG